MQERLDGACPSADALEQYAAGRMVGPEASDTKDHLARCPLCADIVRSLRSVDGGANDEIIPPRPLQAALDEARRLSASHAAQFRDLLGRLQPEAVRFGQFWTTLRAPDRQRQANDDLGLRIVAILADDPAGHDAPDAVLTVVPVSPEIAYRSQDDLLIRAGEGPLGFDAMIEVWNNAATLRTQLGHFLGTLPQPLKRYLGLLYQAQLGLEVDLAPLAGRRGPAILETTDPRIHFQQQEIAACAYLREPALRLLEAPAVETATVMAPTGVISVIEQPFAGIVAEGKARGLSLRQLAERLGLTPALVRKLDLRTFRVVPLEWGVVKAVADSLNWDSTALRRYLQGRQTLAGRASYRADQSPETTGQEDFFQAVRTDPQLTEEQRARWLSLAPPDA